jgi:hypothetical protein
MPPRSNGRRSAWGCCVQPDDFADLVVDTMQRALAPIVARCEALATQVATLEARAAVPGPPGPQGPPGDPGPAGERGADAILPADDLDPDALVEAFTDLLRKELGDLTPSVKKRIIRDAQGLVKYEIEDTASA